LHDCTPALSLSTDDFTASHVPVTFSLGETSGTCIIPITDDSIIEDTETFELSLLLADETQGRISPTNGTAIATIINDSKEMLSHTDYT
jgi:hypothetical protein